MVIGNAKERRFPNADQTPKLTPALISGLPSPSPPTLRPCASSWIDTFLPQRREGAEILKYR